jgi:hypothetical protein
MAEPAQKRMPVTEFLAWNDGAETRCERMDGRSVATDPPGGPHRTIAAKATCCVRRSCWTSGTAT